jgi:tRNA threonylcarbamoyladenosine biosynthesis protein TsaE
VVFITKSEEETVLLGQRYGKKSKGGEVYLLTGDLGGGKTQFAKGVAAGMGIQEPITSPTFNYENIYRTASGMTFYHFDLYRNEKLDEDIRDLMLEAFSDKSGVTVVEWAERAKDFWPDGAMVIEFDWISANERKILIGNLDN